MRLAAAFAKKPVLMPFIMAGDPSVEATERIVAALAEAGADLIELGVPFTDPLADGPINQAAAERALAGGTTVRGILQMVAKLREQGLQIPILLLSYLNPLLAFGDNLIEEAARAGIDGLVIPDLPPEEHSWFAKGESRLPLISFVSPTTDPKRRQKIAKEAQGFLYCVSTTGTTGPKDELPAELESLLLELEHICPVPRVVGFGISSPQQAREVGKMADGVIVGSALVEKLHRDVDEGIEFIRQLKAAL
ncbi:MAG TPA: tryptophan synthase subunit alpha, partial [Bacillota bacterium]|nr:tryptophan synthase subunit alpha [Bacillota bacterium]